MLHIKWKYYTKIVIPPYRPFEWKLSGMKQKGKYHMESLNLKVEILKVKSSKSFTLQLGDHSMDPTHFACE